MNAPKLVIFLLAALLLLSPSVRAEEAIRIAYDPNLPPLHMLEGNQHEGFLVDLMEELNQYLGKELIYKPMTQEEAYHALETQEVDIVLSASFHEQRTATMNYTDSVLNTSVGLVVAEADETIEGISQLTNVKTALQKETTEYEFLRTIRRIQYHVTSNQRTAMQLLLMGRADAFVGNVLTADYLLEESGMDSEFRIVGNYLLPIDYAMAVQRERPDLVDELNQAIRSIKQNGTYAEIHEQWFGNENLLTDRLWLAVKVTVGLLLAVLIITFLAIRWNRRLQAEVDKKTHVLKDLNKTLQEKITQTKNSDEYQRQILDSSPRGIVTVNEEGMITSLNSKALNIAGEDKGILTKSYQSVELISQLLQAAFHQVFEKQESILGKETTWRRQDGRVYYLRYYIYPLFNIQREMIGVIVTFEDITEERQMRLQVFEQEKSQALSRVVAGIAHEIRNPLTSIKTFAELIPKKLHNERFQREISTYVPKEIDRVNQLIEGLIDYARPRDHEKESVQLTDLVRDCAILFERTLLNKGIKLRQDLQEEQFIYANANQVKQVIMNLIINGIDAIEDVEDKRKEKRDGELGLRLFAKGCDVVFMIEDNGIGMTEDETLKVLEPFYTTKSKGTGLGLAIAHQYVHENEGSLLIESKEGIGTKVTLQFRSDNS
ncbi:histidine kinase [Alkalihalophilus pseudofirmus]|uniref:transporter substrate-binding domain-containing protein n=1 Tax=Alkalihalophilus pseudofirmus TaxID=79885 RepID=UPI000950DFB0|nr:histidine kinase [Alkalihalophilus pseudofirmus]